MIIRLLWADKLEVTRVALFSKVAPSVSAQPSVYLSGKTNVWEIRFGNNFKLFDSFETAEDLNQLQTEVYMRAMGKKHFICFPEFIKLLLGHV